MTPDHDQPNGGWGISRATFAMLWCGVLAGICAYGHNNVGTLIFTASMMLIYGLAPHDRKSSSENRQEVSSSKDGML